MARTSREEVHFMDGGLEGPGRAPLKTCVREKVLRGREMGVLIGAGYRIGYTRPGCVQVPQSIMAILS